MADEKKSVSLRSETTLSAEQLLGLLPYLAAKTGLQIEHISNPTIHIYIGEANMDSTKKSEDSTQISVGDITGAVIGAIGSARDIDIFATHVDGSSVREEFKEEFREARRRIDATQLSSEDKADVIDSLTRLLREVAKPEGLGEPGRIQRYILRIKDIAPFVAAALSISASVAKLAGG